MKNKLLYVFLISLLLTPIVVRAESRYLYDVFKKEAENGIIAKEYQGNHQDSLSNNGTKKIYHWYAENDSQGEEVLNKNNVIFGEHCWQMIRTTDTGGVKIIYNGEVVDGKCSNTRENHVGYTTRLAQNLSPTYYYGTDFSYDPSSKLFSLSGSVTTGEIKLRQYTCKSQSADASCSSIYYVDRLNGGSSYYVLQLDSNSSYNQFGKLQFNQFRTSPAYLGYMYNKDNIYVDNEHEMLFLEEIFLSDNLNSSYWYADSINYGTNGKYSLVNPYQISSTEEYSNLVGKYTFKNNNKTYTNTSVFYIYKVENDIMYYIELKSGDTLDNYNYAYTYGNSYIENGDGTYTINNPTTIRRFEWENNYANIGANKYICKDAINNSCSDLWYTISVSNTSVEYIKVSNNYIYAHGFTWDGSKYILDNDRVEFWKINDEANKTSLNNHHYTCFNETGECTTIAYIYNVDGSPDSQTPLTIYHILLNDGKGISDALNEMLYANNVNTVDSSLKVGLEAWYQHYLMTYSDYIEDIIYCNDRSQSNKEINGWNPNGGNIHTFLTFFGSNNLKCPNILDSFSTNNEKAKTKYPVGFLTYREMELLNNTYLRKTGSSYWLGSPGDFDDFHADSWMVLSSGEMYYYSVHQRPGRGVRPVISLKPKSKYVSGNGTQDNPYVYDYSDYYNIDIVIENETKELNVEIEDITSVSEGEIVSFTVTPITGFKINGIQITDSNNQNIDYQKSSDQNKYTFTMPGSDVVIRPSYERVSNSINVEENPNTKEIKIEVNDASAVVYEDKVIFTLVPEEGYEIDKIEIIDKDNRLVDYKKTKNNNEYEFIMPYTDVIIKPKYKLIEINNNSSPIINPHTGDRILHILLFLILIGTGTYIYNKKIKVLN